MKDDGGTDMILLYIDNEPHALAWVLDLVRRHIVNKDEGNLAFNLEAYIKRDVPRIMRRHGDRMSAAYLEKALRDLFNENKDVPDYWRGVARHYQQKDHEGCRMYEYLK